MTESRELETGTRVDHFRVIRTIGRGAQGEVYLARDLRLGRVVALKMIAPNRKPSRYAIERFVFEARATAQFSHPNIVTVHAVGLYDGLPYLALEYVEGESLRGRIAERTLGERAALRIALDIGRAIVEAHNNQLLHRDLKPENVIIGADGRLRVVDFGLAKLVDEEAEEAPPEAASPDIRPAFTALGAGTPAYMAPEQWRREEITPAADVWALGVMTYELLLGRRPFVARDKKVLGRIVQSNQAPPALEATTLSEALRNLLAQTLAREASARPTAKVLVGALEAELEGHPARDEADNPFRGLLAFSERHASMFFGRDRELAAFLERLNDATVLPIVGPSGAGKSSFVQAGVVPRLKENGRWTVLNVRPGADPLGALADRLSGRSLGSIETSARTSEDEPRATEEPEVTLTAEDLRRTPERLALELAARAERDRSSVLLFVDQLEEIVTQCPDPVDPDRFLSAVCHAARDPIEPVRVVLAVRDDFLGRLPAGPLTHTTFSRSTILAPPGRAAQLDAVVRPVETLGYTFDDPALPEQMVDSVHEEAAPLPLLQFTCRALWEERDRDARKIRRATYDKIGGVGGALAHHADGVLGGFADTELAAARTLLLRMVTTEGTRRTLSKEDATSGLGDTGEAVLERLVASRLIAVRRTPGGRAYELAHESLIHTWERLERWIDAGREDLAFLEEVEHAATLWERRGRPRDEAWTGDALRAARARLERHRVSDRVRAFLKAGYARERAQGRRRTLTVALAFMMLTVLVVVFYKGKQRAELERRRAEVLRAESERESAELDLLRGDRWAARAKLRTALEIVDSLEARALFIRLERDRIRWRGALDAMGIGRAGEDWVVLRWKEPMLAVDGKTFERKKEIGEVVPAYSFAIGPDGKHVARGLADGSVTIHTIDGRHVATSTAHRGPVSKVSFDRTGARLASIGWDGSVVAWTVSGLRVTKRYESHGDRGTAVRFVKDTVVSTGWDGMVRFDGKPVAAGQGKLGYVVVAPDDETIASCGEDGSVVLWRADGKRVRRIDAHALGTSNAQFDPKGRWLITSSWDRTVRFWDPKTGAPLGAPMRFDREINGIVVDPEGEHAAVVLSGGEVAIVRAEPADEDDPGPAPFADIVVVDSSERFIAAGAPDNRVVIRRASDGRVHRILEGHTGTVRPLAFRPKTTELATSGFDRTIRRWDAATGRPLGILSGHDAPVASLVYTPDGRLISGAFDQTVRIWGRDGEALAKLDVPGRVSAVAYDEASGSLVVGTFRGNIVVFEGTTKSASFVCDDRTIVHAISIEAGVLHAICGPGYHRFDLRGRRTAEPIREKAEETCLSVANGAVLRSAGNRASLDDQIVFDAPARGCTLAPSGDWFVIQKEGGPIHRFDAKTGQPTWSPKTPAGEDVTMWSDEITVKRGPAGRVTVESSSDALLTLRLHGDAIATRRRGDRLEVTSEVGDHRSVALEHLTASYCDVMEAVWHSSPSVWRDGRPRAAAPSGACVR